MWTTQKKKKNIWELRMVLMSKIILSFYAIKSKDIAFVFRQSWWQKKLTWADKLILVLLTIEWILWTPQVFRWWINVTVANIQQPEAAYAPRYLLKQLFWLRGNNGDKEWHAKNQSATLPLQTHCVTLENTCKQSNRKTCYGEEMANCQLPHLTRTGETDPVTIMAFYWICVYD